MYVFIVKNCDRVWGSHSTRIRERRDDLHGGCPSKRVATTLQALTPTCELKLFLSLQRFTKAWQGATKGK